MTKIFIYLNTSLCIVIFSISGVCDKRPQVKSVGECAEIWACWYTTHMAATSLQVQNTLQWVRAACLVCSREKVIDLRYYYGMGFFWVDDLIIIQCSWNRLSVYLSWLWDVWTLMTFFPCLNLLLCHFNPWFVLRCKSISLNQLKSKKA